MHWSRCCFSNCEEELPKKPVGRLSANRLPTGNLLDTPQQVVGLGFNFPIWWTEVKASCSCASILVIFGFHEGKTILISVSVKKKKKKQSETSVSIVPTGYRHITDRLPTCYRHITNCWSSVIRLVVCVCGKTCPLTVG